jgi:hypothetical protein
MVRLWRTIQAQDNLAISVSRREHPARLQSFGQIDHLDRPKFRACSRENFGRARPHTGCQYNLLSTKIIGATDTVAALRAVAPTGRI